MNIVCHIDRTDTFDIAEQKTTVDFYDNDSMVYTFWDNRNKLPYWYSQQAIDLLYISLSVFAADRLFLRENTIDGWSREIKIYIPVLEYDLW